MSHSISRTIALGVAIAALSACGDGPTAPIAVTSNPTDGGPSEVVAQVGTLVALAPLSGFGAGGVNAINNRRETAGWNYTTGTAYHAFLRAADGTMSDLGTLGGTGSVALAMNDSASIVGLSYVSATRYHGFVSRMVGGVRTMTDLPTLPGGTQSAAYGINTAGTVVGFSFNSAGKQHAVRWSPPSYTPVDLGVLVGGNSSFAYAINDAGTIVGFSSTITGALHAFISTTAVPALTDLGTLGGTSSTARAINNAGDIVGWSTTLAGVNHAFRRSATTGLMTDLGSPGGPSYAFDISSAGLVTGWAQPSAGNEQALVWTASATPTWTDLGTTASATQAQAYALNDSGQVVGTSGNTATIWFTNANRAPVAAFTSPGHSKVNQTPEDFDASTSSDPDGDQLTYSWDFGVAGITSDVATGKTPQYLYTVKGDYNVTLTVTDWRGATATITKSIRIN